MKLRKAEAGEVRIYRAAHPLAVAPLFGFAVGVPTILMGKKTKYTVPVEHLNEGKDNPNYEAILPKGLHLSVEGIHTVIGFTQADLLERLSYGLEECTKDCDCIAEGD